MQFTLIDSREEPISYIYYASIKKVLFCPVFFPPFPQSQNVKTNQPKPTQTPKEKGPRTVLPTT